MTAAADTLHAAVVEAAPGRRRIVMIAWGALLLFGALAVRAAEISLFGAPQALTAAPVAAAPARATLTDRHGAVLAVTTPSATLILKPALIPDAAYVAERLGGVLPEIDAEALTVRLRARKGGEIRVRRGLTLRQQEAVFALGLPGVEFDPGVRRFYPQAAVAAHALGGVDHSFAGVAGVERGLAGAIDRASEAGRPVRLSLDLAVQHVLDAELARAVTGVRAVGGAGIVLDGRTGEVLALASAPALDANDRAEAPAANRLNRAVGAVYEMGSTMKPFIVAAAIDARAVASSGPIDVSPFVVEGFRIIDPHPLPGATAPLAEALAHSSNSAAARLALRLGPDGVRAAYAAVGLDAASPLPLPESAAPLWTRDRGRLSTAILGYGHGVAVSVAALAGAYTIFCNEGRYVAPTLLARAADEAPAARPAFSPEATAAVLAMLRKAVETGTGRLAAQPGLALAGKTGTAEKPGAEGYDSQRQLAAFAAVFPAESPRYVIVLALDEPRATEETQGLATGGATAAPAAGRAAARIAAVLGPGAIGRGRVVGMTGGKTPAPKEGGP